MKKPLLIVVVAVVHCAVVFGSLLLFQGCGTTGPAKPAPEAMMPQDQIAPPAPVPPPLPPPPPPLPVVKPAAKAWPAQSTPYTVVRGDSLSAIAQRFRVSSTEIMALNGIKDPKKLRAGDRIILPGKVNVSAPKPVRKSTPAKPKEKTGAAAAAPAAAGAEGTYQVKAGDSLSRIAVRHKTTSDAIRKANGLKSDKIIVGQKLAIPGAPAQEAAPAAAAEPAAPAAVEPQAPPPAPAVTPEAAPVNEMQELEQAPAPGAAPAAGAPQSTRQHTVAQGEDLYTVAMTYGVSVGNLKQLNGLNDTALTPGQLLKIPASE